MDVILASNSPRRRGLLVLTNLDFRVVPADVDETLIFGESPSDYVTRLAASKAQAVGDQWVGDVLVIAADTTVVDGSQILGKPVDAEEAGRMLRQLRGRMHQVYTAIAVLRHGKLVTTLCSTDVPMRHYTDDEIQVYIDSGDPLDKAGAYAIQYAGFHPVEKLYGCYANVVGLPLCHLARALRQLDIDLEVDDLSHACQRTLGYQCPIFGLILREES